MAADKKIDYVYLFLFIFGFYTFFGFFAKNSVFSYFKKKKELEKIEQDIIEARKKYHISFNEIKLISDSNNLDADYLDELARKKMNYKKTGEVILKYKK